MMFKSIWFKSPGLNDSQLPLYPSTKKDLPISALKGSQLNIESFCFKNGTMEYIGYKLQASSSKLQESVLS